MFLSNTTKHSGTGTVSNGSTKTIRLSRMSDKLKTTKANIFKEDNEQLKKWALEASASEGKILYTSEMIRRVINGYKNKYGNKFPVDGVSK